MASSQLALEATVPPNVHRESVHDQQPFDRPAIMRIAVAVLGAAFVWFKVYEPVAAVSVVGVVALLFVAWPIFNEAIRNLLARRMTMELSMTIAIVAAAGIAEIFTALVVTVFVLVAEELEHLTVARGRSAIRDLVDFVPKTAHVRCEGKSSLCRWSRWRRAIWCW